MSREAITKEFNPATDSAGTAASLKSLCGPRIYTIVEEPYRSFVQIVSGQPDPLVNNWSLVFESVSMVDIGLWTVTL